VSTAQVSVRGAVPYPDRGFRRDVGFGALLFVSLGSIIGSGWLKGAATAATSAGAASTLAWPLASLVIILLALVHAELGAAYPLAGGTARWPRLAFGSLGGFTAGWVAWLQAVTVAPIEVEASLSYLEYQWHGLVHHTGALTGTGLGVAAALLLLFTVINVLGVRWWARSNQVVVLAKIAVPFLTFLVLIMVSFRWSNFTIGGFAPHGASGIFAALPAGVVFALQGFEQAAQLGSEARDPQRNIPRAVIGSVIVGAVLYFLLQFSFIGALNHGNLAQGLGNVNFGPYVALTAGLGLGWLAVILSIDAFVSPADAGLVYLGASARLSYALGHAGYVPRGISRISSRGVPVTSIILAFVVGLICLLPFPSWQNLVLLVTDVTVIMYAFAPITLLALRKADPHRARPYRLPAASLWAPLAFVAANEVIYWTPWTTVATLMLVIAAGYLVFGISYMLGRPLERPSLQSRSLVWIVPWFAGLTVISYLGRFGGRELIPEWVDLGVVAAFSLVICHVAVRLRLPSHDVVDHTFSGGVVRQVRYSESELAILDASAEVVTANWTATVGPALFVSATDRVFGLDHNTSVILSTTSDSAIQRTTISDLLDRLSASTFDVTCEFVRLDLSATQSAFWERLPDENLTVVGFGDHTSTFTEDTERLVRSLLTATATPAVDPDEVLGSFQELAQQHTNRELPHGRGVPE
jgi:amino acid transporter